jgi:hypothetical protein
MQASCQLVRLLQTIDLQTVSFAVVAQSGGAAGGFGQFHQNMAET